MNRRRYPFYRSNFSLHACFFLIIALCGLSSRICFSQTVGSSRSDSVHREVANEMTFEMGGCIEGMSINYSRTLSHSLYARLGIGLTLGRSSNNQGAVFAPAMLPMLGYRIPISAGVVMSIALGANILLENRLDGNWLFDTKGNTGNVLPTGLLAISLKPRAGGGLSYGVGVSPFFWFRPFSVITIPEISVGYVF